jgi:N-acetylglucosaminyldiphosphoundecaprenol N-acetyl-beta-D-mannosaminyltransferase
VTGSDLLPDLFTDAQQKNQVIKLFLLGAGPGVAIEAGYRIEQQWPCIRVVGTYSPPFGFEHSIEEQQRMLDNINTARPDVLAIGLGAPKQEIWATRYRAQLRCKLVLCIGAGIDFLAQRKSRAPVVFSKIGLEWLFRLATEPRRLWRRYLIGVLLLPSIIFDEFTLRTKKRRNDL